jgi:hypothetical protein
MRQFSLNILHLTENRNILAFTKATSTSGKQKYKPSGNNAEPTTQEGTN